MKKTPGDIIILHTCTKNYDQMMYSSWDMVHNGWMDGQTDRQKKWHIEVGAPPKKTKQNVYLHQYIFGTNWVSEFQLKENICFCL